MKDSRVKNNEYRQVHELYHRKNSFLSKQGFSLMEVMAVLFIVMVGMVGVMSLVLQNIQVKEINTNRIIAHQLAQEGIEIIRKQRDTNWIDCANIALPASDCWLSNIEPGFSYKVDFDDPYPEQVTSIEEARLYRIVSGEFQDIYVHDITSQETPFYRMIEIQGSGENINVTVTVDWQERSEMYSYSTETLLFDWK
jgi:type II secretory pathway pseudopilin PulG